MANGMLIAGGIGRLTGAPWWEGELEEMGGRLPDELRETIVVP